MRVVPLLGLILRQLHRRRLSTRTRLSPNGLQDSAEVEWLTDFIRTRRHLVLLTGAGVSTSAGIPDYRSPQGSYSRGHSPMLHQDFVQKFSSRQRYWARSMLGWKTFADSKPTTAHYAFAKLEMHGLLKYIITQNVDRLHSKAGAVNVLDLHGRNDTVRCLSCRLSFRRHLMQQQLDLLNPRLAEKFRGAQPKDRLRADGDAEIEGDNLSIEIPCCPSCGGVMKPDVVFFGDSVPRDAVAIANEQLSLCDGLLVAGTSLEVFSAFRLVSMAAAKDTPIVIVNQGPTRADRLNMNIALRVEAPVDDIMQAVVKCLNLP